MFARFWQGILSESLAEVISRPIDVNSQNLERGKPLRFTYMLNASFVCNEKVRKKQGKRWIEEECGNHWTSNMTTVMFEYQATSRGGLIKMEKFGQSCKVCDGNFMSPMYDRESAMNAGKKLQEKILEKFYGVQKKTNSSGTFTLKGQKPHESDNCEACEKGVCPWGDTGDWYKSYQQRPQTPNPVMLEKNGMSTYVRWDLQVKGKTLPLGGTNEKLNKDQNAERLKKNRAKAKKVDEKLRRYNKNNAFEKKPECSQKNMHQNKKQTKVVEKITLQCDICEINCTSSTDMNSHIQGSKHKTSLEKLKLQEIMLKVDPAKVEGKSTSSKDMDSHTQGSKHQKSIERLQKDASIRVVPTKVEGKITIHCNICEVTSNSTKDMESHIKGAKHNKLQEKLHKVDPTKVEREMSVQIDPTEDLYCGLCCHNYSGKTNYERHLIGKKHKKKLEMQFTKN